MMTMMRTDRRNLVVAIANVIVDVRLVRIVLDSTLRYWLAIAEMGTESVFELRFDKLRW